MGLFLSFLGGAAKELSEQIETSEKDAKVFAVNNVKAMAERMNKVREENKKLTSKLKEERDFLLSYYPNATPDQINEILARPAVMDAIKKYKDPTKISLDSLVKVSQANESDALAAEKVAALPDVVERARALVAPSMVMRRNPLGRTIDEFGATAYRSAAQQTAAALGTTMEELTSTQPMERPTARGQVDMTVFSEKEKKTFAQREDDAKNALLDAQASGDEVNIVVAKSDLKLIQAVKDQMTPAQTKFANRIADVKQRYMFGTPEERAAAKPEYDRLLADIRAEAAAKKTGEGKEDKVPSLGTLNAFTSAAVARRVAEVHGDLVRSKQLAIIERPDGSSTLEYTGDNPEIRTMINTTAFNAAKNALSLYMTPSGQAMTRDVAAVLNSYTPQSIMRQPAPAPAAAPSMPRPAAPAAPATPVRAFKTVEEAEAARLPKGTKITINGRPAEVQ